MLLAEAGRAFIGFILYVSGMKWFTVNQNNSKKFYTELPADGKKYNMSEENNNTLTIKDLTERDAKFYCCSETDSPVRCWRRRTELHVADLQVKVIPSTEGQTVTLICNTSCPLTEKPAAYIWYKNRELLYQDWSPWYQQLVSSEEGVRYSCAVKGYEHLRAPEVSVEVHVQRTLESLTCNTSCHLTDPKTAYRWYQNGKLHSQSEHLQLSAYKIHDGLSCAVPGFEDLMSAEVCVKDHNCWRVNYVRRRICALKDSSVNITSEYLDRNNWWSESWFKIMTGGKEEVKHVTDLAGRVSYYKMKNRHVLQITHLKRNDSAVYAFRLKVSGNFPGVTLFVTGLRVKIQPAVATEGQRVTLTCLTSCPLSDNTSYIWYLNKQPVNLPQSKTKRLVLDPISSQHAGNYTCVVETHKNVNSRKMTLSVQSKQTSAAVTAVAALPVMISLSVFLWMRRRKTSGKFRSTEVTNNMELNPDPVYENISVEPTEEDNQPTEEDNQPTEEDNQPTEEDNHHYSIIYFSNTPTPPPCSTILLQRREEQEHVLYATVNKMNPEHNGSVVANKNLPSSGMDIH
ncbi:hypothetical protein PAMA_016688 [Pampus argenteus]